MILEVAFDMRKFKRGTLRASFVISGRFAPTDVAF
jgi:hypothetical protein